MAEPHGRSGGAVHPEAYPPHHILAEVEHRLTAGCVQNLHGRELLRSAHRWPRRGDQCRGDCIDRAHTTPVVIVISRSAPAIALEPSVVGLAIIDVRHDDRAGRGLPCSVGADDLRAPIGVTDHELGQEPNTRAIVVATAVESQPAAIPPVPKCGAHRIRALLHERRHVVGIVLETLVVARPARREQPVAHATAIQLERVEPEARCVEARRGDASIERELATQHGSWIRSRRVFREVRRDPSRLPVTRAQKAQLEERRQAPRGCAAGVVPDAHLPVVARSRVHGRPTVRAKNRFVRCDATGVPERGAVQRRCVRRHANLIGALHRSATIGMQPPTESRRSNIDADGILLILGTQPLGVEILCAKGRRHRERARTQHHECSAQTSKTGQPHFRLQRRSRVLASVSHLPCRESAGVCARCQQRHRPTPPCDDGQSRCEPGWCAGRPVRFFVDGTVDSRVTGAIA